MKEYVEFMIEIDNVQVQIKETPVMELKTEYKEVDKTEGVCLVFDVFEYGNFNFIL